VKLQLLRNKLKGLIFEGEILKLMSLSVMTKPIGLVSQVLMAKFYGAGVHYDAYLLSYFLVTFLAMTLGRVFSAVIIPFLTTLRIGNDGHKLNELVNATLLLFAAPMVVFSAFLIFGGGWAVSIVAPNAPHETKTLTIQMLKIMAIPGIMMALVETINSIFNLNKAFRIPAMMPIINSVTMLVILVLGHKSWGIWALPIAFSLSQTIRAVVSVSFALAKEFIKLVPPLVSRNFLKELWSRSWVVLVSSTILTVNLFVDKYFASGLVEGSISSIAYSITLVNFGSQIFQFSLVTVMFTKMSEFIAKNQMDECGRYIELNFNK